MEKVVTVVTVTIFSYGPCVTTFIKFGGNSQIKW